MAWTEVQRWTVSCPDCKGTREMVEVEDDLGWHMSSCVRWCACAPHKIVSATLSKVDPEGS